MAGIDPYHKWLGIPPHEQPPTYYRLLGIDRFESDPEVIQAAADRQMAHVRTYQGGEHAVLSQRLLNEIASAKLCLIDGGRRASYDAARGLELPKALPEAPEAQRWRPAVVTALPVGIPITDIAEQPESGPQFDAPDEIPSLAVPMLRRKKRESNPTILIVGLMVAATLAGLMAFGMRGEQPGPGGAAESRRIRSEPVQLARAPALPPHWPRNAAPWPAQDPLPLPEPVAAANEAAEEDSPEDDPGTAPAPVAEVTQSVIAADLAPEPVTESLAERARKALANGDTERFERLMQSAAEVDRTGIDASFALGLYYAIIAGKPAVAERRFRECSDRLKSRVKGDPERDRELAIVQANLGLAKLQQRKYVDAITDWKHATAHASDVPDCASNIVKLAGIASRPLCSLPTQVKVSAIKLAPQVRGHSADGRSGWRYAGLRESLKFFPTIDLEDRRCMFCGDKGSVDCPVRGCAGGRVTVTRENVVGRNTATGENIFQSSDYQVPCRFCHGEGRVPCWGCERGSSR